MSELREHLELFAEAAALPSQPAWTVRYHVPRSQVWEGSRSRQAGAIHLHATEAITVGRITRAPGRALCGKRGWYERPVEHESDLRLRCAECERRADRHEIAWPA